MRIATLIQNSLKHYWRTNLAVILGVATAVAVLAGALLVGDSVRASLRELALSRLGKTDVMIAGTSFFRAQLANDLQAQPQFNAQFNAAAPLIALPGVATHGDNQRRAGGVQIYGVDERFWQFHGQSDRINPDSDDVFISEALARELEGKIEDAVIVRIEKPTAIPVESLHGRKDEAGITLRSTVRQILPASSLGEFSLQPQQGAVRAIFVSLQRLQRQLEQDDKANVILLSAKSAEANKDAAVAMLKSAYQLADLGLKVRALDKQQSLSLESDSALMDEPLSNKVRDVAATAKLQTADVYSYLANTMQRGDKQVPYSLVTAIAPEAFATLLPPNANQDAASIVINDWTARELGAKIGDEMTLEYYLWQEQGTLETKTANFRIAAIVPMQGLAAYRDLVPDYPGISGAESLSDWDPPFPVDLKRVRKQDEDYWHDFRTTPKAFVPLEAGQKLWASRYGNRTSIRLTPAPGSDLTSVRTNYEQALRSALDPLQSGLSIHFVREQALQAARGATDFGEYFTYFSFFLVVSALLLTVLFFKLGIEQRLREIGLLRAVGFSIAQIRSLFLREGILLAVIGSVLGIIGAIAYGGLMMYGLRTWWVGAVGTTLLRLHIAPLSLLIGALGIVLVAVLCVWWVLRSLTKTSPRELMSGSLFAQQWSVVSGQWSVENQSMRRRFAVSPRLLATIFGVIGLLLLLSAAFKLIGQVGGFFGAGITLLIALLFFWSAWLRGQKQMIAGSGWWPVSQLGFRNATTRPGRSVLCIALIAFATFIIVAVDAFRKDNAIATTDKKSGTGGYVLSAESLLPIVHDPNAKDGRAELNLEGEALTNVKIERFRVRPGDDTSCLNLYQPRNPRILGVSDEFIKAERFTFQNSLAETAEEKANPWLLLEKNPQSPISNPQSPVPVIADANSMTYVLHKSLGDTLQVNDSNGQAITLQIVAALSDSLLQGELLMSEKNFLRLFPDQQGWRFFLIDAPADKARAAATILEDRLSDFGFDATTTAEKLAEFHRVENTYLSTFQALGGLGLLLGTVGLAAVLLRNVLERRRELALLRATGFQPNHLSLMIIAENVLLLGCGLLTGIVCALLAVAPALWTRGGQLSIVSLLLLLAAVFLTGLAASLVAVVAVQRAPLLTALRAE
ncbi:MAG TPA: ABC transporter permease [Blastocatellia bacterium]|nr:ABC transporter permease [Blastocatellia bacterium]